jgi:acetyl/propionyl-CoA carboxylase alpha subunit
VEIQLLGDGRGTVLPFVERECSIQRRHQKVVEEAPSPVVGPELRQAMAGRAAAVARAVGYTGAGTIEFLLDPAGAFYFLEMNTRLQVEHPVTEMVTGVDLVQWQIRIARGEPLTLHPERLLTPLGHAIECRIYAEDPSSGFLPSPGTIARFVPPSGPGVRNDAGFAGGTTVPTYYDSLISKLIVWGETRAEAVDRLRRALGEFDVLGIRTTIPFFQWLVDSPEFRAARFDTAWLDTLLRERGPSFEAIGRDDEELAALAAAAHAFLRAAAAAAPASSSSRAGAWRQAARLDGLR